jgi:hypothetical protein
MKRKPSPVEANSGGRGVASRSARSPRTVAATPAAAPPDADHDARTRENKTIRLRKAFEGRLKTEAYQRSMAEGRRVTESDIIDEALELYFRAR